MNHRFPLLHTAVAALTASGASAQAVIDTPVKPFAPFRNVAAHDKSAAAIRLADYATAKRPVVLVFVASRCGITWLYADKIAALQRDYGQRASILLVHSNFEEPDAEILGSLKEHKLSLRLLDDTPKQELAAYFDSEVTPVFVVIDGNGVLRYRGAYDKMGGSFAPGKRPQYLLPALDAVLAGKPVAVKTTRALGCDIVRRKHTP